MDEKILDGFISRMMEKMTPEAEAETAEFHSTREREAEERRLYQIKLYCSDNTPERYRGVNYHEANMQMDADGFICFGDFGTGKTHAAYQIAHRLMWDGKIKTFKVKRAFAILSDIKGSFGTGTYDSVFRSYISTGLLIVDEYGKNQGSDFEDAQLFEILNTRYENCKRTGIIVNAKRKEDLLNLIRPDVLDRFRANIIEINGKSRR